jgi:hypothetical protein
MKVKLKQNWFGPDGKRYRKGEVEMPDSFEKLLPKSASIVEEEAPEPKPKAKKAEAGENPDAEKKPAVNL